MILSLGLHILPVFFFFNNKTYKTFSLSLDNELNLLNRASLDVQPIYGLHACSEPFFMILEPFLWGYVVVAPVLEYPSTSKQIILKVKL